jgi:hypothetical protein
MSIMAACPFCKKTVDNVSFQKQHLAKRRIPVWHSADGDYHHWALDKRSSENLRTYLNSDEKLSWQPRAALLCSDATLG